MSGQSGAVRPCTRCRNGDEYCQVGQFYLCDNCDRPRRTGHAVTSDLTYPRPVGGPYDMAVWARGDCPVCGLAGREGKRFACDPCYTEHVSGTNRVRFVNVITDYANKNGIDF